MIAGQGSLVADRWNHIQRTDQLAKGFLVAHIHVPAKEKFEEFKAMSGPAIAEIGGCMLLRNPSAVF